MDDEQLADLHRFLAEYHRRLAKEAVLDVVQQYHADLAQRLADEAALIPRRTAIAQRLREGEQQKRERDGVNGSRPDVSARRMGGAQRCTHQRVVDWWVTLRSAHPTRRPFRECQSKAIITTRWGG